MCDVLYSDFFLALTCLFSLRKLVLNVLSVSVCAQFKSESMLYMCLCFCAVTFTHDQKKPVL